MICIPIREKKVDTLIKNIKKAQEKADVVEVWFDEIAIPEAKLKKIFKDKKKPFIYKVTNGKNLKKIATFCVEFLDVDHETPKKEINNIKKKFPRSKTIISYHDFKKTPTKSKLTAIFGKIKKSGADIVKIAVKANTFEDNLVVLEFLSKKTKKNDLIALCMGGKGGITRIVGHLFGNYLVYVSLEESKKTASGQIDYLTLKKLRCLLK